MAPTFHAAMPSGTRAASPACLPPLRMHGAALVLCNRRTSVAREQPHWQWSRRGGAAASGTTRQRAARTGPRALCQLKALQCRAAAVLDRTHSLPCSRPQTLAPRAEAGAGARGHARVSALQARQPQSPRAQACRRMIAASSQSSPIGLSARAAAALAPSPPLALRSSAGAPGQA